VRIIFALELNYDNCFTIHRGHENSPIRKNLNKSGGYIFQWNKSEKNELNNSKWSFHADCNLSTRKIKFRERNRISQSILRSCKHFVLSIRGKFTEKKMKSNKNKNSRITTWSERHYGSSRRVVEIRHARVSCKKTFS
jgi:hypothetical protein